MGAFQGFWEQEKWHLFQGHKDNIGDREHQK